jgi:hypothetical protein
VRETTEREREEDTPTGSVHGSAAFSGGHFTGAGLRVGERAS